MDVSIHRWIGYIWITVGLIWAVTALRLKPVAKVQSATSRIAEVVPLVVAGFLLFRSQL